MWTTSGAWVPFSEEEVPGEGTDKIPVYEPGLSELQGENSFDSEKPDFPQIESHNHFQSKSHVFRGRIK